MNNHLSGGWPRSRRYYVFPTTSDKGPSPAERGPEAQGEPEPIPSSPPVSAAPQMRLQHGLTMYAQGNILGALWAFSEGIDLEPASPLGHYLCGLAFQALGHGQEARDEWETVLTLTSDNPPQSDDGTPVGDASPRTETQWVRGLVQRLLERGRAPGEERLSTTGVPGMEDVFRVIPEDGSAGAGSQGNLETAIRDAVRCYGHCYIEDRSIAYLLQVTTEEQVVGWKQSFSAREGLTCHPHRKTTGPASCHQESSHGGVIFKRGEA